MGFAAVPALPDGKVIKQVVCGGWHTMVLADDGTVFACGRAGHGQLGLDTPDTPGAPPNRVSQLVSQSSTHSLTQEITQAVRQSVGRTVGRSVRYALVHKTKQKEKVAYRGLLLLLLLLLPSQ